PALGPSPRVAPSTPPRPPGGSRATLTDRTRAGCGWRGSTGAGHGLTAAVVPPSPATSRPTLQRSSALAGDPPTRLAACRPRRRRRIALPPADEGLLALGPVRGPIADLVPAGGQLLNARHDYYRPLRGPFARLVVSTSTA